MQNHFRFHPVLTLRGWRDVKIRELTCLKICLDHCNCHWDLVARYLGAGKAALWHSDLTSVCFQRWLVTAKHTCTLCMWLCIKWRDVMHGCMVYTERAEMAAVSSGTNHARTKQCCKYAPWVDTQSPLWKDTVTHLELYMTRAQWVCSRAENSAI